MADGRLGKSALAAATWETLYTVPADTTATIYIAAVNRAGSTTNLRIGITEAATPADEDYIEYDASLPGSGGVLERTGIVVGAGEKVMARASQTGMTVRVHGFED